jgi:mRNA interferase HigB
MRLIGQDVLVRAMKKHVDAGRWLTLWAATVADAACQSIEELRTDYPSADGLKLQSRVVVTVFNVTGNNHRLLTNVDYAGQVVQVLELLTHAEYDKERWKVRY